MYIANYAQLHIHFTNTVLFEHIPLTDVKVLRILTSFGDENLRDYETRANKLAALTPALDSILFSWELVKAYFLQQAYMSV